MQAFPMRFLLYASLLACTLSIGCCPKIFRNPQNAPRDYMPQNTSELKPIFDKVLYNCQVDGKTPLGKKFHLSGLLVMKEMPEGGTRIVFQNQMGLTYFDFGWDQADRFEVHSVIEQMNKPALLKLLKKDFELLLFKNLPARPDGFHRFSGDARDYLRFNLEKGFVYYIYEAGRLAQIVNADEKRKVIVMDALPATVLGQLPEQLKIRHLRANFTIDLQQIKDNLQDVAE